jgi:membrane protease subunit HflK
MTVKQAKRYLGISTAVVALLVLLVLAFNSIYIIQEQEQAVVVTLGKPSVVTAPGPHFKIPLIQDVQMVPMVISGFSIGYSETGGEVNPSESLMITSDYNFVNVDFFLEYQVSDPERYLYASYDPELILRNMALSYIRDTIGLHTVDEVITTGKNQIQSEIKEKMLRRLEEDNIGLTLVNITIQDAEPPTVEVIDAFKNVETAKQGADTAINTARKYESEQIPAARAQEDSILKSAEAQREGRINEAKGQVAVFNAMFEEYRKNPLMTKQRMFYEGMEAVLPGMKIVIESGNGETTKLLPLDDFTNPGATAPATPTEPTEVQ